jgi:phosphoribosylformylglycinamidine (FGAM) synthase-like amidotransferase family enzyme
MAFSFDQAARRRKQTQQDRAIARMLDDMEHWDKHQVAWLIGAGFSYSDALRLLGALTAIQQEPMTHTERIEYLRECLRWGACR